VACVTIGSGETVFASRGGAIFGYALLWVFVLSTLFKGIQVYAGSRFMVLTGAHPLESWAKIPGPKNWLVWLMVFLTVLWMPFYLGGGLPRMLGDFMNSAIGWPSLENTQHYEFFGRMWGTVFILVCITLTLVQRYGFLEKVQTTMVAILLVCMLFAAATCHPDFSAVLGGLVIPRIPDYEPWVKEIPSMAGRDRFVEVIVYLGAIGGGTQDYIGYLGMMREKGWGMLHTTKKKFFFRSAIDESAENVDRGRQWMRAPLIDTGTSFSVMLIFTLCFAVLGAAILNPQQIAPEGNQLLTRQANFLVREDQSAFFQVLLIWVYRTGTFFAIFGTIYGAYELYTRTTRECLAAAMPRLRKVTLQRFRVLTVAWCGIPGLLLLWLTDKDPVAILTPAAIVSSTLACGVWCFAMLWSDAKHLPGSLRMPRILRIGVLVSGLILFALGLVALYKQYLQ
tara:strand:- start:393 stop:1748 length:1356 start_codon:yes stop_codon:yes gene_type:complete